MKYVKWKIRAVGCATVANWADISKEADCGPIQGANREFGRIDVLVNNTGIQDDIPIEYTTTAEWYKIVGVDLTTPWFIF
jgi:glucose 1-dehydrogenase